MAKDAVRELNEEHPEALYFYQLVEIRSVYQLAVYCTCYQLELVVVANSKCPKQEVKSYDEIEASADDKQFKVEAIITGSLKDSKRSYNFKISSL